MLIAFDFELEAAAWAIAQPALGKTRREDAETLETRQLKI